MADERSPYEVRQPMAPPKHGPDLEIDPAWIKPGILQQPVGPGEVVSVPGPGGADPKAVRGPHPSGVASWTGNMMVEVAECRGCGEWYPRQALDYGDLPPVCPRCTFAVGLPPLGAAARAALLDLRWRLNEYTAVRGRNNERERDTFMQYYDACYHDAPALLRFLEALYGDQVVRGVHEVAVG